MAKTAKPKRSRFASAANSLREPAPPELLKRLKQDEEAGGRYWANLPQITAAQRAIFDRAQGLEMFGRKTKAAAWATPAPAAQPTLPEREAMRPKVWFDLALKEHRQNRNESKADYARRLLALMRTAPVRKQWTYETMHRRLYEK